MITDYIKNFISDPVIRLRYLNKLGFYNKVPDEEYLKKKFRLMLGYELNLDDPKTFSEKLQWLKLYDHNPGYTKMVDKYETKKYAAEKIGSEYIIPTLGVWNSFGEIDFDSLPNQFVLKCTHDSGGVVICRDKTKFHKKEAKRKLSKCLNRNYYWGSREWPYKNVVPRILAENYLEDDSCDCKVMCSDEKAGCSDISENDLTDYKFFCFHGKPVYCQVIKGRSSEETVDFFDMKWNHMEFTGLSRPFHNASVPIPSPVNYKEMQEKAAILAENTPFVRVDFYEVNGRMYFGEITFYPASGFGAFTPSNWNYIIGDLIELKIT